MMRWIRNLTRRTLFMSRKYTPEAMIAVLIKDFVAGTVPPGIDEHGRPVYKIVNADGGWSGCAISQIARVQPEFITRLEQIGLHEKVPAARLHEHGVDVTELLSTVPGSRFEECHSPRRFIIALQDAHDDAAAEYFRHKDMAQFRKDIGRRLDDVARNFELDTRLIQELAAR